MTISKVSVYNCLVFAAVAAVASVVTAVPGRAATTVDFLMGGSTVLAIFFAAVAIAFTIRRLPEPKWLLRVFQAVAVAATLFAVFIVAG